MHVDSSCHSVKLLNILPNMTTRPPPRRFTRINPCPICGGHDALGRGRGIRCFGYFDAAGKYARCTREERAGSLPRNLDGTYSHRLSGPCGCGTPHGGEAVSPTVPRRRGEQRFRSYFTLAAYLRRRYGDGSTVRPWIYRDADGDEVFRVVRVDYRAADGSKAKSYRPCRRGDDERWLLSRPDLPLPLYNLPAVSAAPPSANVAVLEGEKCADIAAALGLIPVTTSAHGAQSPQLTDWSPLAGRSVAILRDGDERGAEYAAKVAAILNALDPPARIHIVSLPGLADGEDVEQFVEGRRLKGRSDADILAELRGLIAAAF